jgi:hypothetical protein
LSLFDRQQQQKAIIKMITKTDNVYSNNNNDGGRSIKYLVYFVQAFPDKTFLIFLWQENGSNIVILSVCLSVCVCSVIACTHTNKETNNMREKVKQSDT